MPPAPQTTSRSQCAPLFLEKGRIPETRPHRKGTALPSKEISCVVNAVAAPVADAGAESVRQLGCHRRLELRRIFRRLATLRLFLPKTLGRLPVPRFPGHKRTAHPVPVRPTD